MTSIAPGTVMQTSTIGIPPAQIAPTAASANSGDDARMTGTIPTSIIPCQISSRVIGLFAPPRPSLDPRRLVYQILRRTGMGFWRVSIHSRKDFDVIQGGALAAVRRTLDADLVVCM